MRIIAGVAAVVMALCGLLLVLGVGKPNVWMGVAFIGMGLSLVGYAVAKPKA